MGKYLVVNLHRLHMLHSTCMLYNLHVEPDVFQISDFPIPTTESAYKQCVSLVDELDTHIISIIEPGLKCFGFTVQAAS